MENGHLNSDTFIRAAYGVAAPAEAEHLAGCAHCSEQASALAARRARPGEAIDELPETFWQRQQQAIFTRLRQAAAPARRAAVALALSLLLAVALLVMAAGRQQAMQAQLRAENDKLLREVSTTLYGPEPRALAPMRLIFTATEETRRP